MCATQHVRHEMCSMSVFLDYVETGAKGFIEAMQISQFA